MPLTGDFGGLRRVRRELESLGTRGGRGNNELLGGVDREVKDLLRAEFESGVGPEGPWEPTKQGDPALLSKKLAHAFESRIDQGSIRFFGKTKRDMLTALHGGYIFPPKAQSQFYDRRGRSLKLGRLTGRGLRQKFVEERRVMVGPRVLPARPVFPLDGLTPRWEAAIGRGLTQGMEAWFDRASR